MNKDLRLIISAGIGSFILAIIISVFTNSWGASGTYYQVMSFLLSFLIGFSLWITSALLNSKWLPKYCDWLNKPIRTALIVLVSNIVVVLFVLNTLIFFFQTIVFQMPLQKAMAQIGVSNHTTSLFVALFITLVYQSKFFLETWKVSIVEQQQLEVETAKAKYEALNAQLNPHFLFNSLNVLLNLIPTNPDKAEQFVEGLSDVYRYVLDVKSKPTVGLKDELNMLVKYNHLMLTRFGERLQIENNITAPGDDQIVPLTLQVCMENAVKHNTATLAHPLCIKLWQDDTYTYVENTFMPKKTQVISTNLGIENVTNRFKLIGEPAPVFQQVGDKFLVKIKRIKTTK